MFKRTLLLAAVALATLPVAASPADAAIVVRRVAPVRRVAARAVLPPYPVARRAVVAPVVRPMVVPMYRPVVVRPAPVIYAPGVTIWGF